MKSLPINMDMHWIPFTSNRSFKKSPRIVVSAHGRYYTDDHGKQIFDSLSGLWTCGLGHGQKEISTAVSEQMSTLDYAPAFNVSHPKAFQLAERITEFMPASLNRVFFTCSGSESIDTALKMARAYWRKKGLPGKSRLIGRRKGYHGVNFGGISVGGINANRALYGATLEVDHLPHTMTVENRFSRGMPETGKELADELMELIILHDASNIAAVVIEPMSGSAGVIPPPKGYLNRIREICDQHNILLIFDEVITAFGRVGAKTGAQAFGVTPDIMTMAKQITNGVQPLGAVVAKDHIYQCFMENSGPEHLIEFPHGYTYSAHPVACAAALATLDLIERKDIPGRVREIAPKFERSLHSLKEAQYVTDIRNYGLAGGITLEAAGTDMTLRPVQIAQKCWDKGFYVRCGGDTLQFGLPFTVTDNEIDILMNAVGESINELS